MSKLVLVIIALFIPPLAVFLKAGLGKDFLINLVLCCFLWVPGILHGIWIVTR